MYLKSLQYFLSSNNYTKNTVSCVFSSVWSTVRDNCALNTVLTPLLVYLLFMSDFCLQEKIELTLNILEAGYTRMYVIQPRVPELLP